MIRRERVVLLSSLALIALLAWAYLVYLSLTMQAAGMNTGMGMQMSMPVLIPWAPTDFLLTFAMWAVMMVAMMTPASAPIISLYYQLGEKRYPKPTAARYTGLFMAGYLAVWVGFSAVATVLQWILHNYALINDRIATTSPILGGIFLIAAGVYQFTPLKNACLSHCQSPLGHLMSDWREKGRGAFIMGVNNGINCLGCCWLLMVLLFVGGVMNLFIVAAIAIYVLVEKVAPVGLWLSRAAGAALVIWGLWMVTTMFRMG